MSKWWIWLLQSVIWILAAMLNHLDGRSALLWGYNLLAAALMAGMGLLQRLFERMGDKGKRPMRIASIAALLIVFASLAAILLMR